MDPYSLLLGKMPKEELEQKINEKIESMSGFLTRDAAANILANEMGLRKEEKIKLNEIKEGANKILLVAKLERILKLQEFGNGKKMRKIVLSDESGERELKLWNEDAELLNNLHSGDILEIREIYCKNNELGFGYSGEIKVVKHASFADLGLLADLEGTNANARGYVEGLEGMKEYEREGRKRKMFPFTISDGKNSARAVIWDEAERGNELFIGGEIKIENARVKNRELHLGFSSRLLVKKKREGLSGKIESLEVSEGKLVLGLDSGKHEFSREDALKILGAKVAGDISLETVAELKKKGFLGKEIFIEIKDGKIGKVVLRG